LFSLTRGVSPINCNILLKTNLCFFIYIIEKVKLCNFTILTKLSKNKSFFLDHEVEKLKIY